MQNATFPSQSISMIFSRFVAALYPYSTDADFSLLIGNVEQSRRYNVKRLRGHNVLICDYFSIGIFFKSDARIPEKNSAPFLLRCSEL